MSARDELLVLDGSDEWPSEVDAILNKHRAEVLREAQAEVAALRKEFVSGEINPAYPTAIEQRALIDAEFTLRRLADAAVSGGAAGDQQPHCTAEYGGPGYTHCELAAGHDGQHESALGNLRRATWGGER